MTGHTLKILNVQTTLMGWLDHPSLEGSISEKDLLPWDWQLFTDGNSCGNQARVYLHSLGAMSKQVDLLPSPDSLDPR